MLEHLVESPAGRVSCYRCFWPQHLCWCGTIKPMATRTRFVLLMHPKEFKREKAGTGRLTHLCLTDSLILMGTDFDHHEELQDENAVRDAALRLVREVEPEFF